MKCQHCGKNEVTFMYQSNINGHVAEQHLCSRCAEEAGYTRMMAAGSRRLMDSFRGDRWLRGGLLGTWPSMLAWPQRDSFWQEDPFEDFFRQMPVLGVAQKQAASEEKEPLNQEEQGYFSYLRQRNALQQEQKRAIKEENFERAAQLRDEIRALEESHKEEKHSA